MAQQSRIEWTDATWNPVTGCTKISEGCRYCYAEVMAHRLRRMGQVRYRKGFDVAMHGGALLEPLRWKRPRRVFVCSMGDLFHEDVPFEFIDAVWHTMHTAAQHLFLVLTKRPARAGYWCSWTSVFDDPLPNVCVGVTAENQREWNRRVGKLVHGISAHRRFVSCEPLLGPICVLPWLDQIDQIIIGCESGPRRRPCDLLWARALLRQAFRAGAKVFVKQLQIDGKVSKEPNEWPEDLRVRQPLPMGAQ